MSKTTTTLHVYHTFLYISSPFLHDYGVKMPNFSFNRELQLQLYLIKILITVDWPPKKQ